MTFKNSKITAGSLALAALFCLLFMNVFQIKYLGGITGIEIIKEAKGDFGVLLFLIAPIAVALINFNAKSNNYRALLSSMMFLPFIINLLRAASTMSKVNMRMDGSAFQVFGPGMWLYIFASIAIIIVVVISNEDYDDSHASEAVRTGKKITGLHNDEVRRTYSKEKLQEIIDNEKLYNPELVERCKKELSIRQEAEGLIEEVRSFDGAKIADIMRSPEKYSPAVVYCCQREQMRLRREQAEQEREQAVAAERQKEEEAEQKRQHRAALWKKYQWYVYGTLALIVIIAILAYIFSDGRYYKKGLEAYDEGDNEAVIEWLSGVSDGYKDYPTANWMLFRAYLNMGDSAMAAKSLENAVSSGEWDKQPEAAKRYCKYATSGGFEPYITIDYTKCADLMKTAYEGDNYKQIRVGAGELYFSLGKFNEAYDIFSCYATERPSDYAEKVANGYRGIYYIYGLNGREKDIAKAKKFLRQSADSHLFHRYRTIVEIATMTSPSYSMIEELSNNFSPIENGDETIRMVLRNLVKAKRQHTIEGFTTSYDNGWGDYRFNNYSGFYEGEMTGKSYWGGGSADGWGVFTNKSNGIRYTSLGIFKTSGKNCFMQGDGFWMNYNPDNGRIFMQVGKFNNDNLTSGISWTNDTKPSMLAIPHFCCVP